MKLSKYCEEINIHPLPRVAIVTIVGNWCNMKCRYCFHYLRNESVKQVMNLELLEKFIKEYLEFPLTTFSFNWHGGEPLLAGLKFFEKIIEFQDRFRKKGQRIRNLIQTNGTLITKKWASFFKSQNFGIGVSLDGTKESHDQFRVDNNNHGSFERVIKGIEILRKHGVKVGILQTLTRNSIPKAKENFQFLVDVLKVKSFAVNPYCDVNGFNQKMIDQIVTSAKFTKFLRTLIV